MTPRAPQVSFLIPVHRSPGLLEANVPKLTAFLEKEFRGSFEVLLIPNPLGQEGATLAAARKLGRRDPRVRTCTTALLPGKGRALKEGFAMARGRWILTTDADLPYDLSFFTEAARLLGMGYQLVLGNRRLPTSRFRMSKKVLSKIYPRVLMGRLFNLFVRMVFPLRTTDTQAGLKAMTREAAEQVFRHQVCPRFSYDIEMLLTARGLGYRVAELPVTLHLESERSTIQIFRTFCHAVYWIGRIAWRHWRGDYDRSIAA